MHPVVFTVGGMKELLLADMTLPYVVREDVAISCKKRHRIGLIGCCALLSHLRCSFGSCGGVSGD